MTLTPSFPGVSGLATTTDARKAFSGLVVKSATGVPRSGVFPRHTDPLVTARTDMNVDIGAFEAAAVQFGGTIFLTNDGTAQLPNALTSPASGTYYYVIYAKQNENTAPGTDANNNLVFGRGVSAISFATARATLPAGAVELATVEMPTGKTATDQSGVVITQTFQYTAAAGGVVWLRNSAEMDAWTPADGAVAYRMNTGAELLRAAGAWKRLNPAMGVREAQTDGAGLIYITHGLGETPTNVQLTSALINETAAPLQMLLVGALTSTQIQVVAFRNDSNARLINTIIRVHWVAWP